MRLPPIFVFMTVLLVCLVSCRETMGEQHKAIPQENNVPATQREPVKNPEFQKDGQQPTENKPERKKIKARDTLRPGMALLH